MTEKHFKKKNENKIVSVLLSLSSLLYSYLTFLMNSFTVIGGIWIWQSHGCFLFPPLVFFPSSLWLLLLLFFSFFVSFSSSFLLLFLLLFLLFEWYFRTMNYLGLIHSSILAWRSLVSYSPRGSRESDMTERLILLFYSILMIKGTAGMCLTEKIPFIFLAFPDL